MLNKKYIDTRDSLIWEIIKETEKAFIFASKDAKRTLAKVNFEKLLEKGIYKEAAEEEKKNAKIPKTHKVGKDENKAKMQAFRDVCSNAINAENYGLKEEEFKNKLILTYTNPTTKKTRNITELFLKVRNNIISCFIREEDLMNGIEYDKELAATHKEHNYNFWIEKSLKNTEEEITDFIQSIINNHIATLAK